MDAVQLSLDIEVSVQPKRDLLPDGRPTAGQRWLDALEAGIYEGNFLEFCRWEMRREAESLGFRCVVDYFSGITMKLTADKYHSITTSALDTVSKPHTYTPEQLGNDEYKPERQWSMSAKYRHRLRLLKRRVAKKYSIPELYEKALALAIASKPDYYGQVL
jgi:hypothetical protein